MISSSFQQVLQSVEKHIPLTNEDQAYFLDLLKEVEIPKKTFVQTRGQLCKSIHFVSSGLLRAFLFNQDGKETTVMFAPVAWWITDMFSFINERASLLDIQAVENSTVLSLSKHKLDQLYQEKPVFERFFRILMQNAYIREQLRSIQNLSMTAEERYDSFLSKYPDVANQVTQKQLASYLGITPEFLSTIRHNKSK